MVSRRDTTGLYLLREEILDASEAKDLRELTGVAKSVWEPGFPRNDAKRVFEVPLAV